MTRLPLTLAQYLQRRTSPATHRRASEPGRRRRIRPAASQRCELSASGLIDRAAVRATQSPALAVSSVSTDSAPKRGRGSADALLAAALYSLLYDVPAHEKKLLSASSVGRRRLMAARPLRRALDASDTFIAGSGPTSPTYEMAGGVDRRPPTARLQEVDVEVFPGPLYTDVGVEKKKRSVGGGLRRSLLLPALHLIVPTNDRVTPGPIVRPSRLRLTTCQTLRQR